KRASCPYQKRGFPVSSAGRPGKRPRRGARSTARSGAGTAAVGRGLSVHTRSLYNRYGGPAPDAPDLPQSLAVSPRANREAPVAAGLLLGRTAMASKSKQPLPPKRHRVSGKEWAREAAEEARVRRAEATARRVATRRKNAANRPPVPPPGPHPLAFHLPADY